MEKQYEYVCSVNNALSAIPNRLYYGKTLIKAFSVFPLKPDPASLHEDVLLSTTKSIEYKVLEYQIYGIIKHDEIRIVFGPIGQFLKDHKLMENVALILGLSTKKEIQDFIMNYSMVPDMPFNSFLWMLCSMNLYINDEKLSIEDISLNPEKQADLNTEVESVGAEERFSKMGSTEETHHNTLSFENMMLHYVETGDEEKLQKLLLESAPGTYGTVSPNYIRNSKNLFIVTTTLVTRAAIKGGLEQDQAFNLSDYYIQQCEQLTNISDILNLGFYMIMDYTAKVNKLKEERNYSEHVSKAIHYIKQNFASISSTEEIADANYISLSYLSTLFKKETNYTLIEYVLKEKIEEAKRLLQYTNKSLSAISNYLNFSSQSHFNNAFKKEVNMTPNKYRKEMESK